MRKELVPVATPGTALQPSVDEYSRRLLEKEKGSGVFSRLGAFPG
jgi:hypothetical protein